MHRFILSKHLSSVTIAARLPQVPSCGWPAHLKCLPARYRPFHMWSCMQSPNWIKMPSLSPTMTEGSIAQWSKKEGEEVQSGDVLCEIQTDKAVVALECEEDGVLAKILVHEKAPNIQVGSMIAVIAGPDENWEEVAKSVTTLQKSDTHVDSSVEQSPSTAQAAAPVQETHVPSSSIKISPAARLLIQSHGLDSSKIPASGPRGNLLKEDVLCYLQGQPAATSAEPPKLAPPIASDPAMPVPSTISSFVDIPLTNMRQTIAKRLTMSKSTIPHAYVRAIARLDRVMELRQLLKSQLGLKVSVNDVIIKACALGLRLAPNLNATSDATSGSFLMQPSVDICMAVATPSGLITPILRNVDSMPISQVASLATSLAKRARDGKLQPHEFQGGSFTISNLGMYGIREFTAIINPPQVAILAVGSGFSNAVGILPDCPATVRFANTLTLTLSIDSRYVAESMAGKFLNHVSQLLSDHPHLLFADDPNVHAAVNGQDITADQFDTLMLSTEGSLLSKTVVL